MIHRDLARVSGQLLAHCRRCLRCGPLFERLADPRELGRPGPVVDCSRGRELVRQLEQLLGTPAAAGVTRRRIT